MKSTDCDLVFSYKTSLGEIKTRTFSVRVSIPDEIIEDYAREKLGLMSYDEAVADYEPDAPDYDYEPD